MVFNRMLKNQDEVQRAFEALKDYGVRVSDDFVKHWDNWVMLSFVRENIDKTGAVLDVGTKRCRILELLYHSGFRRLYGCDLAPIELSRYLKPYLSPLRLGDLCASLIGKGPLRLSRQDLTKTEYPDSYFAALTSISVIEHGVDIEKYLKEAGRLLKPGGWLLTTTDYWITPIDTSDVRHYGLPWKIFSQTDIERIINRAQDYGLVLRGPIDYTCEQAPLTWHGRKYTAIFFALQKTDHK